MGIPLEEVYEVLKREPEIYPRPALDAITCPVLAIFGEQDTRVNVKESVAVYTAAFKQTGNLDVTIKVFPEANHHIRIQQRQTMKGTKQPRDVFAPGFLELIEEWLQQRFPTR